MSDISSQNTSVIFVNNIYVYIYVYIYILGILGYCNIENYAWRLVVIQNLYEL